MSKLMTAKEFVKKAHEINNHSTIYILGTIGQKVSRSVINETCNRLVFNRPRRRMYEKVIGKAYAFDCVGMIKAILWNWSPNKYHYSINGVPDINANDMIRICSGVSSNFTNIELGAVVHLDGHIGIYIGDGKVIECSPKWKNSVQISKLNQRNWTSHGKLPWVDYSESQTENTVSEEMTVVEAKRIIKEKTGLQDGSIHYMYLYRWGDALLIKLAKAMI